VLVPPSHQVPCFHPVPLGKLGPMEDTWTSRDLPVLDATVALLENRPLVDVTDIAARAGLTVAETGSALQAMEGAYVELAISMGGPESWSVQGVTPAARRAVGQWPSAESLITRLVEGPTRRQTRSARADCARQPLCSAARPGTSQPT